MPRSDNGVRDPDTTGSAADFAAACRRTLPLLLLFSLGINLLMLTAPLYMLQLFDRVIVSRSGETLLMLTLIAGAALVTLGLLDASRSHILLRIGVWLERRLGAAILRSSVVEALNRGGEPSIQGLRDIGTVRAFVSGPGMLPFLDAPWVPIFLTVIFLLHPLLGLIALAGAVGVFTLAICNEALTRTLFDRSGGTSVAALRQADAAVRNADAIQGMGMLPALSARWSDKNAAAVELQRRASGRAATIVAFSKFARLALQVGVLGAGAYLVIGDAITPGAMIAASILMARALAPVDLAIGSWRSAVAARGAYRRIARQLAQAPARRDAMTLPAPRAILHAEAATVLHPGLTEPTLRNISFELEPGEALGLIGASGSGKTTLARMLVGNLAPRFGSVRLDGIDIARWNADERGRHVGYMPQDIELFGGSVRDNIARMGDGGGEDVIAAARRADVHDMVLRLADGYETDIGPQGARLSGGQRQRIALARALYGDPKLVVLDEPNASLDPPGEAALIAALHMLKRAGAAAVVITHQPRILNHLDKILALNHGQVQMFGPAADILPQVVGHMGDEGHMGSDGAAPAERRLTADG